MDGSLFQGIVTNAMNSYVETPLARLIAGRLDKELFRGESSSRLALERRRRANIADARAVDRIIFVNRQLEDAYLGDQIPKRHPVFLPLVCS